jgi:hypothetical protein
MKGSAQRAFTYEPPQVAAKGDSAGAEPPYDSWDNERFFTRTSGILHRCNEIVECRGVVRGEVLQGNNIALLLRSAYAVMKSRVLTLSLVHLPSTFLWLGPSHFSYT